MEEREKRKKADEKARKAAVIVQVLAGNMTAKEGAKELGVSRTQYYKLERRVLSGIGWELEGNEAGRPAKERDPEKEALKRQVVELKDLLVDALRHLELKALIEDGAKADTRQSSASEKKRKRRRRK